MEETAAGIFLISLIYIFGNRFPEYIERDKANKREGLREDPAIKAYLDKEDLLRRKRLYLDSKIWKIKRKRMLLRDNYKCKRCNSPENLNIHHISYERLEMELDSDLVTLCTTCHTELHKKLGYELDGYYPINYDSKK